MRGFLLYVGWYNFIGSFVLLAMHFDRIADVMLRKVTEVVPEPYTHGKFARIWLWWAGTSNVALGWIMIGAVEWPPEAQRHVTIGSLFTYVVMWLCVVFGARRPTYARGVYFLHPLWLAQVGWGIYALWDSYGSSPLTR